MRSTSAGAASRSPFYFSLLFLIVVIGFYPTYFSKLANIDLKHHFHAIVATTWMLMLVLQSWLVAQKQFQLHRMVGRLSIIVVLLFVISGAVITHTMLAAHNGFSKAFGSRLAFGDITTVLGFVCAYGLAIHFRRQRALHSRFMASTALLALPPALARVFANFVPGVDSFVAAFHASYLTADLILLTLIIRDYRQGIPRSPYYLPLAIMVIQELSFIVLPGMPVWNHFTGWLGSL